MNSGARKSDHFDRRRLVLMRRADTESGPYSGIGSAKRREPKREKPSMPKLPWNDDKKDKGA